MKHDCSSFPTETLRLKDCSFLREVPAFQPRTYTHRLCTAAAHHAQAQHSSHCLQFCSIRLSLALVQICFVLLHTSSCVSIFLSFQDICKMSTTAYTYIKHKLLIIITDLERQMPIKKKKQQLLRVI